MLCDVIEYFTVHHQADLIAGCEDLEGIQERGRLNIPYCTKYNTKQEERLCYTQLARTGRGDSEEASLHTIPFPTTMTTEYSKRDQMDSVRNAKTDRLNILEVQHRCATPSVYIAEAQIGFASNRRGVHLHYPVAK